VLAATVLVADDDADILRFMEINLRLEGFEVVTARDGPDALAKAAAVRPDLVLLDVRMPGIDGYTICARIRADAPRGIGAAAVILVPGGAAIASRAGWSFPPSFHRPQPDRTRSHSLDSTPDVTCETTSRQILPDDQHTPPTAACRSSPARGTPLARSGPITAALTGFARAAKTRASTALGRRSMEGWAGPKSLGQTAWAGGFACLVEPVNPHGSAAAMWSLA
jgi:CheY-like chemotaxis protein